jgi:hypothetical protein
MKLSEKLLRKVLLKWFIVFIRIGLYNNEGKSYFPSLVRIGPNAHSSLRPYTLEYLIEKERESNVGKERENIQTEVSIIS